MYDTIYRHRTVEASLITVQSRSRQRRPVIGSSARDSTGASTYVALVKRPDSPV